MQKVRAAGGLLRPARTWMRANLSHDGFHSLRACEKLPVAMADIEEAVQRIETRCRCR